jgi:hypothetical protein
MGEHLGLGPDGSNPLGFLCALGAFLVLSEAFPAADVRLSWRWSGGWRPVWKLDITDSQPEICDTIFKALTDGDEYMLGGKADLNLLPNEFRLLLLEAAASATMTERKRADILAAYGCEATLDRKGNIRRTALCLINGQGHQHLLTAITALAKEMTRNHVVQALFNPWLYQDTGRGRSFRWDPVENRQYALRADNPSGVPIRIVHGANRLAVEALRLFPTVPAQRSLETTGFTRSSDGAFFTWPIWQPAVSLATVRSLLTIGELRNETDLREKLSARGVNVLYRCRRFNIDRRTNFSSAFAL